MKNTYLKAIALAILPLALSPTMVFAAALTGTEDIAKNIVASGAELPGLVTGLMYLLGLIFVITGLFKIKDHVDNEKQTPLRVGFIRLVVAGMLFAAPLLYEVMYATVSGTSAPLGAYNYDAGIYANVGGGLAAISALLSLGTNFNAILANIVLFSDDLPGVVSAAAYLLGVIIGAIGIVKIKEHVEEPEKVGLKEPVTRLLTAGALFALPAIFTAAYTTIAGTGLGIGGTLLTAWTITNFGMATYSQGLSSLSSCIGGGLLMSKLSSVICTAMGSTLAVPTFLMALSYVLGLFFTVWAILKVRDHVLSPTQTKLAEGVQRLIVGGAFFALPYVSTAIQASVTPWTLPAVIGANAQTGFVEAATCTGATSSLDEAMVCLMINIASPMQTAINFFSFCAGLIFVMVGVARLARSSQEGPKGPGGAGTIATFVAGGVLMSGTTLMPAISASLFGSPITATQGILAYSAAMSPAAIVATHNVISAVVRFMIIVGLISFVRGVFILRDSAEGKQASVMSGITHIIGGALAVNIGPLVNAVQSTLGITAFGVTFS